MVAQTYNLRLRTQRQKSQEFKAMSYIQLWLIVPDRAIHRTMLGTPVEWFIFKGHCLKLFKPPGLVSLS